jgi:hypothetical protein
LIHPEEIIMKKIILALATGLMMLGMGASAHAVGVGVKAGTLGLGAELGFTLSDRFTTRLALNKYKISGSRTIDGVNYDADLDLSSTAVFLDWSPFTNGSLHLTVGYVNSDNQLSATANAGSYDIGGNTYSTTVNTTVDIGSGPYVGIGWGNVPATGIGLTFELGVVKSGAPKAHVTAPGASASDIATEEKNIQDELDKYDVYPVITAGISIGF